MSAAVPLPSTAKLTADIARARRHELSGKPGPRPITAYEPCESGCGRHVVGVEDVVGVRFVAEVVKAHLDNVQPGFDYTLRVRRHRCSGRPS